MEQHNLAKLGITFSSIEGKIASRFATEIDVVREPCKSCEFPLGLSDDLLVGEHLDRPPREGGEQNCTIHGEGGQPFIDRINMRFFFFLRGFGRSTCFPPTDMDNSVSSLSVKRDEFSGSSKSNSTYSPRKIACLVFVET